MAFVLDRELYLTEDKKTVVEANDPRARFVLGVKGSEIPDELARELGLDKKATKPLAEAPKATEPTQNKAATVTANKGK